MEMVCNAIFNEHGDTYSSIARQLRLWRDYADEGAQHIDGRSPADLARQATGLDVEDFLALGFAFVSHTMAWRPGGQLYIPDGYFPRVDPGILDRFLDLVATTPRKLCRLHSDLPAHVGISWSFSATPFFGCPQAFSSQTPVCSSSG
jgi:hypothetical protein